MENLKLKSIRLIESHKDVMSCIKSDSLKPVAESFVSNIDRINSLLQMPSMIACFASVIFTSIPGSRHHVARELKEGEKYTPEEQDFILAKSRETTTRLLTNAGLDPGIGWKFSNDYLGEWWSFIDNIPGMAGQDAINSLESFLSGIILGTWTAFEVLAGDLWEEAVNASPLKLATLEGKAGRIGKLAGTRIEKSEQAQDRQTHQGSKIEESKYINLNEARRISGGTFDLSCHMGNIHRKNQKFTSLTGIREAYSLAFSHHADFIDANLSDHRHDALSLVRNLIVHKAGIADQVYVDDSKGVSSAPKLAKGDRLQVDGEITSNLVYPVIESCCKLIKDVDSYILRQQ